MTRISAYTGQSIPGSSRDGFSGGEGGGVVGMGGGGVLLLLRGRADDSESATARRNATSFPQQYWKSVPVVAVAYL
jgi:hypothetical protein